MFLFSKPRLTIYSLLFPRVHMKDDFLVNASLGSCGSANKSGWMTEKDFVLYLQHFVKHARPSLEKPVLLLLDNHGSHLSVEGLNYAKANGIIMLSFPPHTSHRLQPLDLSVYGPLKHYVNGAIGAWLKNHPGQTMTFRHIPGIVKEALPSAITPRNIMAGFEKAGVAPYNRNIFTEDDFAPSMVTDRPNQNQTNEVEDVTSTAIETATTTNEVEDVPPTEIEFINLTAIEEIPEAELINAVLVQPGSSSPSTSSSSSISSQATADGSVLENLRPLPKAGPRKTAARVSRQRKTAILTSTPVKDMIEKEKEKTAERATKKLFAQQRKATKKTAPVKAKGKTPKKRTKTTPTGPNVDEKECYCLVCQEPYSKSISAWIQCKKCGEWAHEDCVDDMSIKEELYWCDDCI